MKILQKSADEDFIVLNFTDTQLTDGGAIYNEDNVRTILENTMSTLVSRVKPNLITVSGDLAVATNKEGYRVLADILDSFQIPWAFVWGNHDNEKGAKEHRTPTPCPLRADTRSFSFLRLRGNNSRRILP